jgi:hypothetical protein
MFCLLLGSCCSVPNCLLHLLLLVSRYIYMEMPTDPVALLSVACGHFKLNHQIRAHKHKVANIAANCTSSK